MKGLTQREQDSWRADGGSNEGEGDRGGCRRLEDFTGKSAGEFALTNGDQRQPTERRKRCSDLWWIRSGLACLGARPRMGAACWWRAWPMAAWVCLARGGCAADREGDEGEKYAAKERGRSRLC